MSTRRINWAYTKVFPHNCPVIETTADGTVVGTCTFHMPGNVCPRHGEITELSNPPSHDKPSAHQSVVG